jgi:hypothetical protein
VKWKLSPPGGSGGKDVLAWKIPALIVKPRAKSSLFLSLQKPNFYSTNALFFFSIKRLAGRPSDKEYTRLLLFHQTSLVLTAIREIILGQNKQPD